MNEQATALSAAPSAVRQRFWKRWTRAGSIARGCLLGFLVCLSAEVGHVFLADNLRVVIPNKVYRCSQPSAGDLERLVREYGIRTVINLRGPAAETDWYREEARASNRLNVSQVDIGFSAARLPSVRGLRRLVEVLERGEKPVVFHCFRGVDRTGLASVVALLLLTDTPLEEAREELSLRYFHLPWGRTAQLDEFCDLYEEWLTRGRRSHSRDTFREWATKAYCPGVCRCRLELLGVLFPQAEGRNVFVPAPENQTTAADLVTTLPALAVPADSPFAVRVRAHNTSIRPWRLHPDSNVGVHAFATLIDERETVFYRGRAGLYHAAVPPGASIDLTVALPALATPGTYRLQIDMIEEQHCFFHQAGSEPLDLLVEVR